MYKIEDSALNVLLNQFYSFYFVDYLEALISDDDEEYSAVTLVKGMEYFIQLCNKLDISLQFDDVESYILNNYEEGKQIYDNLQIKYSKELKDYYDNGKSFEEEYGELDFLLL